MSGIYTLLSAAKGQQRNLEATSNNLANVNTPGYRADRPIFKEFLDKVQGQDLESEEELFVHNEFISPFSQGGNSYVVTDEVVNDVSQGLMKHTGNKLDIALSGKGYFVVSTPYGDRYTRNGKLHIDADKRLVTPTGDPVLGKKGPVTINGNDVSFGVDGVITVDGKTVDQLQVVSFAEESKLAKLGNSYFAPSYREQRPMVLEDYSVRQGVIESSNVDTVKEMVNMIGLNRSFESSQKAIRTIDELDDKSISMSRI